MFEKIIRFATFFSPFLLPKVLYAAGYVPLEALPGINAAGSSLTEYVNALFKIGIGVAIVLAVIMLVVAGVEYIGGASSESTKKDAKERIENAIVGLLIALGSWLILFTINPNIIGGVLNITVSNQAPPMQGLQAPPQAPPQIPPPQQGGNIGGVGNPSGGQGFIGGGAGGFLGPGFGGGVSGLGGGAGNPGGGVGGGNPLAGLLLPDGVPPDTSTDDKILDFCLFRAPNGDCAPADFNVDGSIDTGDTTAFYESIKYDLNRDGKIDLITNTAVESCFIRGSGGGCAIDLYGDMNVSIGSFGALIGNVKIASNDQGINLGGNDGAGGASGLWDRLFPPVFDENGGCFVRNPVSEDIDTGVNIEFVNVDCNLRSIVWNTIKIYDLDGDNKVETSDDPDINDDLKIFNLCMENPNDAGCARADFNKDGFITQNDGGLIGGISGGWAAVAGGADLYEFVGMQPNDTISLSDIEILLWQPSKNDSDLGIINFCMNKDADGGCAVANFNDDEVVDLADKILFDSAIIYDINGDSIVDTFIAPVEDAVAAPPQIGGGGGLPDQESPVIILSQPSGELQEGIGQTTLSVMTNEAAVCKYSENPGVAYGLMTDFENTGDSVSTQDLVVENGATYDFYIKCADLLGNTNANDHSISFSVSAVGSDQIPPSIVFSGPSGEISSGSEFLLVMTDEVAVCKYSTSSGEIYSNMQSFSSSTSTVNVQEVSTESGNQYTYYIKCADVAAIPNINPNDYEISFSVI